MKKFSKILAFALVIFSALIIKMNDTFAFSVSTENTGWKYELEGFKDPTYHVSENFSKYFIDGELSYCIEPKVHYGSGLVQGNWLDTGLNEDAFKKVNLIAYYGYTYDKHQTLNYYAATQGLIWETIMGNGYVKFASDYWSKGKVYDISKERNDILQLVNNHELKPNFNGDYFKVLLNDSLRLTDHNNVLDNYDIITDIPYFKEGNSLFFTPNIEGKFEVVFRRRDYYDIDYKLFISNKVQNMLVPGNVKSDDKKIIIEAYKGSVEGHKKDKEVTVSQGQATLARAKYGIYDKITGELVTTFITNENGYFKTDNILEAKEYYIQELEASEGYKLDTTRYDFKVTDENTIVDVYEEVIKNKVTILKQYKNDNEGFLSPEENIYFEILYPNKKVLETIITDNKGIAFINLPYGSWIFHQVNTKEGYNKVKDFMVVVDENSEEEQYYNLLNEKVKAYVEIIKVDEETNKDILLANTTFKILNKDTNKYVVDGKDNIEFKTDSRGRINIKLEKGNYKLIEIDGPYGYMINDGGLDFNVEGELDNVITIRYYNKPIKGRIEINKLAENFVVIDGLYTLINKPLEGVVLEIYALEDIFSSDNQVLYYKKNEIVDTMVTDYKGYSLSKLLPLGKYYIKEKKTGENYILDETEYFCELKATNKDNVIYTLNIINYLKKGALKLLKVDSMTNLPLKGVLFEFYDDNDNLIYIASTNSDGQIVLDNLPVGKYYAVEKNSKEGYILTDSKFYFEINDNLDISKLVITNEKINVPITGLDEYYVNRGWICFILGGIGFINVKKNF